MLAVGVLVGVVIGVFFVHLVSGVQPAELPPGEDDDEY